MNSVFVLFYGVSGVVFMWNAYGIAYMADYQTSCKSRGAKMVVNGKQFIGHCIQNTSS